MIMQYRELYKKLKRGQEIKATDEGIRRQIYVLLNKIGFIMQNPKKVECKRCVSYDTLCKYYKNLSDLKVFENLDPCLLFNADETEVSRKGDFPGKVASHEGEQPCCVVEDKSGTHVSLFIMVSAAGDIVYPTCILHGGPDKYLTEASACYLNKVRCIRTPSGYMNKETFKNIIETRFIPYVNRVREGLPANHNKRAVLVVDGHLSRHHPGTYQSLRDNNIDFVILLSHTSHITQPLDKCLNRWIKTFFQIKLAQEMGAALKNTLTKPCSFYVDETKKDTEEAAPKKKRELGSLQKKVRLKTKRKRKIRNRKLQMRYNNA